MTGAQIHILCNPTRKQAYFSEARAEYYRERVERRTGRPYRSYRCPRCGLWHLTSKARHR